MVDAGTDIKPFVVKFFQREQEDERHSVVNEVLGSILAHEFELPCPKPALIELGEEFQLTLGVEQQKFINSRDERIKFGCELLDGVNLFIHSLNKYIVQQKIPIETVFAFDVLIRNHDRTNAKPNLLIGKDSAFLIDHELAFNINLEAIDLMKEGLFERRFADHHIYLPYLRKAKGSAKAQYFTAFEFYLQNLRLSRLNPFFRQLAEHGI